MTQLETLKAPHEGSLSEQVADQISQLIINQKLEAGDKIPNEFELASALDVGRGSIREAVKLLVARNILTIKRGKGTFVAKHIGQVDDPMGFAFYSDELQLARDLLEVRLTLEPAIARMAAERATKEDEEILLKNLKLVEDDILNHENHLPNDAKLHVSIAKCTQNSVFPKLIPVITYSVNLFGTLNKNSLLAETITGHRAIVDAIIRHDPDAAQSAMIRHLEQNKASIQEVERLHRQEAREKAANDSDIMQDAAPSA